MSIYRNQIQANVKTLEENLALNKQEVCLELSSEVQQTYEESGPISTSPQTSRESFGESVGQSLVCQFEGSWSSSYDRPANRPMLRGSSRT